MCRAKGILCQLRHYASTSILKKVYFGLVDPYLQYVMTLGNKQQINVLTKFKLNKIILLRL